MKITPTRFAKTFVRTRNGSETAVRLGYSPEEAKELEADMLARKSVKRAIRKLDDADEQNLCYVKTGLSRLAFGSINDAAALLFADEPAREEVLSADLFNVAEIKKVKGGGVEMKFYDRQKALEKLVAMTNFLNDEALRRFQYIWRIKGIDEKLKARGIKEGDTVHIGSMEFEWRE